MKDRGRSTGAFAHRFPLQAAPTPQHHFNISSSRGGR
jgi:hypothetical protein